MRLDEEWGAEREPLRSSSDQDAAMASSPVTISRRNGIILGISAMCLLAVAAWVIRPGGAVALMEPDLRTLQFENALAAHAVSQFSTAGGEGFEGEEGFKMSGAAARVAVDRSLDTVTKESSERFRQISSSLKDANKMDAGILNKIVGVENEHNDRYLKDKTAKWALNRKRLQDQVDYTDHISPVLNPDSDTEGKLLLNQVRSASEYAKQVATSEEGQDAARFAKLVGEATDNQSRLAAAIVGLKDPSAKSQDELQLLKRDEMDAKCISSGQYESGGC